MISDALYESLLAGGWTLIPIYLVGVGALYLLLRTYMRLGFDIWRRDFDAPIRWFQVKLGKSSQMPELKSFHYTGPTFRVLKYMMTLQNKSHGEKMTALKAYFLKLDRELEKGLLFVGVLAAAAPLLGLLGTVSGMVATFQTITLYGNSNPVLLAEGISEALMTTQSGLVIAFPVILFKHRLEDRVLWVKKQLLRLALQAIDEMEEGVS